VVPDTALDGVDDVGFAASLVRVVRP